MRFVFLVPVLILLAACAAQPAANDTLDPPLTAEQLAILDNAPDVDVKPCDIVLPNGERTSIFLMQVDPQSYLELSCREDEGNCIPFAPDRDWEDTVRVKLRQAGCGMDLIQQKLPGILAEHCRLGIAPACQ